MSQPKATVVDLSSAQVPADQGLSSLGLLMQLGGSLFAAAAALGVFVVLFGAPRNDPDGLDHALWLCLVLGLCAVRSAVHRVAGTQLLYGRRTVTGEIDPTAPLTGMQTYVGTALVHSALVAVILSVKLAIPVAVSAAIAAGLASWPVTLAVVVSLPRFARFRTQIPLGEDKGFEGASILMTVFGLCGAVAIGTLLVVTLHYPVRTLAQGPGVLMVLSLVMLAIRSLIHMQAGRSGLRETSVDRSVELANRYTNFGVISTFCAGGALLMVLLTAAFDFTGLAVVAGACWMMMAWPLIVRRFYRDRQFAELLGSDHASPHRRAPDAGLGGLGWWLIATAVLLPALAIAPVAFDAFNFLTHGHSLWWSVGLAVLQTWAGYELVRMGPHHRAIASVYAVVGTAVAAYLLWPLFATFGGRNPGTSPEFSVESFMMLAPIVPMAMLLVTPIATLALVHRNLTPTAQARFRVRPAGVVS